MLGPAPITDAERAALDAATDPVERARLITVVSRRRGTLPGDLAVARGTALAAAHEGGARKIAWIALKVGLTPSRVSSLILRYRTCIEVAQ